MMQQVRFCNLWAPSPQAVHLFTLACLKNLTSSLTRAYLGLMTYVKQTDVRSRTIALWSEPMGVERKKILTSLAQTIFLHI